MKKNGKDSRPSLPPIRKIEVSEERKGLRIALAAVFLVIGAVAIMRPSRSVADLELKSVKKKFKTPAFAAGCSREVIQRGADMLGWSLDELIERTILAMRATPAARWDD